MSCFLIDKASFAKAAGIVAGIADAANQGNNTDRFWLYSRKANRNMTGTDFLDTFFQVYEMSRKSVSESWKEEQTADTKQYSAEFKKACALGRKAYYSRWQNGAYLRIISELRNFFSSARYQIDNEVLEKKVSTFLNAVLVQLLAQLGTEDDTESWGSFDLATVEEIMTEEEQKVRTHVMRALSIEA